MCVVDAVWLKLVQHHRRFGCRNTSYGTVPKRQNPSKIHAQGAPNGFEDRGPFSTFEPAKSKELERDGWMGYRSFAVQHRRRCGCRNTSEGTVPHPSKIHAQAVPHGFEDRGPFSTFEPANSKELERDGWMGYRSFAVQHRRRFGCRNTSEGTVAKRQNPSKIRAQAQQKTVRSAGPKQHLWSPLRRRKAGMDLVGCFVLIDVGDCAGIPCSFILGKHSNFKINQYAKKVLEHVHGSRVTSHATMPERLAISVTKLKFS